MRILLDYRPALRGRTGVGEYVHELARALVATCPPGEGLTLFSSSRKDRLAADVVPGARVIDKAISVSGLNFAWHRLGWPPVERITGETFDVVHASHPLLIPSTAAARLVTIYDLDFLDHPERTRAEIRRDYPPLAPDHARRADQVLTISEFTAREIARRLEVPPDRISIARPGAPAWQPRDREPDRGILLFLGTLGARKNLDVLLDAYERLIATRPDAPQLVLAGAHTPESSGLVARATRAPLAGRVDLPGYVDDEARRALFDRAMLLVLPSHMEGFGLPVLEAMTAGVPVVVSNRGALPELVGDAGDVVDTATPEPLAAALARLIDDPRERQRRRETGLARARHFTWHAAAVATRDAWARAVDHHRASHG